MDIDDVYKRMLEAAEKTDDASARYRERDKYLEVKEMNTIRSMPKNRAVDIKRRIDTTKDDDPDLNRYFNRYKFWRGEQIRLGELLTAEWIYRGLRDEQTL